MSAADRVEVGGVCAASGTWSPTRDEFGRSVIRGLASLLLPGLVLVEEGEEVVDGGVDGGLDEDQADLVADDPFALAGEVADEGDVLKDGELVQDGDAAAALPVLADGGLALKAAD